MFDKLDFIVEKYKDMSLKVSDPDVIADQPTWQRYIKDMGEMEQQEKTAVVQEWHSWEWAWAQQET